MTEALRREEALRSAVSRLPVAVVIVDGERKLQAYNSRATALFEREGLGGDLLDARPHHPLSRMLREILEADSGEPHEQVVKFPSGSAYRVEPSQRSEKGMNRWLMLLVTPEHEGATPSPLDGYQFTGKERQLAELILAGAQTDAICTALGITGNTFKTHMARVLQKTGTRNRAEFVSKLLRPQ